MCSVPKRSKAALAVERVMRSLADGEEGGV